MKKHKERVNFIGLAELREGHGYFILPAPENLPEPEKVENQDDNFTVSLRLERGTATLFCQI